MKNLYLIRHAKASWEHPELPDFDRPLIEMGEQQAHMMASQLKEQKLMPDGIVSSTAVRALETAKIMSKDLDFPAEKIVTNEILYSGSVEEIIELIKDSDPAWNTVCLFAHNPNLTWLAHYLCDAARMNIPTCGVVGINFEMKSWKKLVTTEGSLLTFIYPPHEHA